VTARDPDGPAVICYDGSPSSATAIAVAEFALAGREALVCHSWVGLSEAVFRADPDTLPAALRQAAEQLDDADREAAAAVAAEGVRLARAAGFDARSRIMREQRKTWRTLLEAADEARASVIVAGAHGLSGIGRALLGSVSTSLLHHATRPLLIVPQAATVAAAEAPLLLCYDGSEGAEHAIAAAGELLRGRQAVVLNCWESWVAHAPVQGMTAELDEIPQGLSEQTVADGARLAADAGFAPEPLSARAAGAPWRAVLDAADEADAALIVLGSRGLTGLSRALGSVSNRLVHHSQRPVLIVPEPARR